MNEYKLSDALTGVGMSFAGGYSKAVESGIIIVKSPAAKGAAHIIPYIGELLFLKDVYTFGTGFRKGWNAYER